MSIASKRKLKAVYSLISKDLKKVDAFISETLKSGSDAAARPLVEHVLESQGKRVRPVLLILSAYTLSKDNALSDDQYERLIKVAAAIELIHMASLVHDDVIDDADVRRDQASIKAKWGNPAAVAFGVYLYSISLQLIAESGLISVLESLSLAVKGMCEGELFQLAGREQYDLSVSDYKAVIKRKTADLFVSACKSGALVSGASSEQINKVGGFGHALGMIFQITDDVLDIVGDGDHLKKEMGQDLVAGQVTLPFIYLQEAFSREEQLKFLDMTKSKVFDFKWIQTQIEAYGIEKRVKEDIKSYEDLAKISLSNAVESKYKKALLDVLDFVVNRS